MNFIKDYENLIIDQIPESFVRNNNFYYDMYSNDGRNVVEFYQSTIYPIIKGTIPCMRGGGKYFSIVIRSTTDVIFIIKNIFLNKDIPTDIINHMILSTPGLSSNKFFKNLMVFREEIFNMSEEEYLMWRMSI